MGRKKINPKAVVKVYLKNMPESIKVQKVFLFGSFATGKTNKDSDLDFIVISPDFNRMEFMKRLELLSHVQGASSITRSIPMDILGYTPKEFANIGKESIILQQAKKEGKVIFSAN